MPDALIMGGVKNSDPACAMLRPASRKVSLMTFSSQPFKRRREPCSAACGDIVSACVGPEANKKKRT